MNRSIRMLAVSVAVLAIAGCAGLSATRPRPNEQARPAAPDSKSLEMHRSDLPGEAQQFFLTQRLPSGAAALDAQWYVNAQQHASALSWYSSAQAQNFAASTPAPQLQQINAWQQLGPGNVGGRTRVLRFQPGNPNTIFVAGVDGGLWKSTDAGASWNPLTDLASNLAIVSMVIDSSNPLRMWVGTGEGEYNLDAIRGAGIFYSSDGGISWNQLLSTATPDFYFVDDLLQSPNHENTLYAGTNNGVFRSLDGGNSWTKVVDTTATGANLFHGCFSLKALPGGPADTVLAACGSFATNAAYTIANVNGIVYRNTDAAGVGTWTSVLSVANQGRATLAVAPSNPLIVYALVAAGYQSGTTYDNGLLGVWQSADGGATWSPRVQTAPNDFRNNYLLLSNPLFGSPACGNPSNYNQGWYDNIITVDPTNANVVWVGGIDLWRSDDGAANWGVASYWWKDPSSPNYAHADNHSITFHPNYNGTTNQQLFVTSDGGLFRSSNAAAAVGTNATVSSSNSICGSANLPAVHWSNLNNGYAITQFYDGAVYPGNATYFAGAQDNGTRRGSDAAGPQAWSTLLGGDGGYVAVDPTNTQNLYAEFTYFSMRKSTNGGVSFSDGTNGISDSALFINPFIIDENKPARFWTGGNYLWRSDNAMGSWSQVYNLFDGNQFSAFAVAPYLSDLVLAGTGYGHGTVYRLTGATSATFATAPAASVNLRPITGGYVSSLTFDPTQTNSDPNARTALAALSTFNPDTGTQESHVFKSTNGGVSWTGIDGMTPTGPSPNGLPNVPANAVLIDPTTRNAQRIFVGTDIGVFVTTDGGASWARENTGFANTSVRKLVMQYNPVSQQWELFAFTHGRSVYKTAVQAGEYIFANGFN